MPKSLLHPEKDRVAVRDMWVRATADHLKGRSHVNKWLGVANIRELWRNSESGSGTCAEALTRLTAMGHGDMIDKVGDHLDDTDDDLQRAFGLRPRWR